MRYSIIWHDDAQNAAPEERATVGDLVISLCNQNITLHLCGKKPVDHLTISLYPLAEGLAHDWWSLFGGRDRELSLIKHRSGYVVPDIRMKFDGAVFEFTAQQRTYVNPDVQFWTGPTEVMDRQAAEASLDDFIDEVLNRLTAQHVARTNAALRWSRVKESRANPDEAAFCETAGALGLDPYEISDEDATRIDEAAELFEGEALTELLAGARRADQKHLISWVQAVEKRPKSEALIGELREAASDAVRRSPKCGFEEGWSLGYRRARALRHVLNLQAHDRILSFKQLAEKLGASRSYALAGPVDGLRALRSDHDDGVYIHVRSRGDTPGAQASYVFSFARAVGDAVCFPDRGRAPVNELRAAFRQGAGRAFAAEFLAPIDEIRSMHDAGHDTVSIADEFGVSTTVIERQWENRDRIDAACSR